MAGMLTRVVNAVRRAAKAPAPDSGRVAVRPTMWGESMFEGDLTPTHMKAILRSAAYGEPREQFALFESMLETDGRLASAWRTRRLAVTGLDWELLPATQVGKNPRINETFAENARDYCLEVLADLEGWDEASRRLVEAIGYGTAVVEIEYEGGVPIAAWPIDFDQLLGDWRDIRRVRVAAEGVGYEGIALDEQAPGKFIIHTPNSLGGSRFRGGLLRACVPDYMLKRYGLKWWAIAVELFGMPITIGKYRPEATAQEKLELLRMIRDLGVNRGGAFPVGTEVELTEAMLTKGEMPHERVANYVNQEYAIEFQGATLTTQVGESGGNRALGEVHAEVRDDLRNDDIASKGQTIRQQLLGPLVAAKFGEEARRAAPYYREVVEEAKDLQGLSLLISTAVNELGAEVPAGYVETVLGVPLVDGADREAALPGRAVSPQLSAFGQARDQGTRGSRAPLVPQSPGPCDCVLHAHRALTDVIARRKSGAGRLAGWVVAAVLASQAHTGSVLANVGAWLEKRRTSESAIAELPGLIGELPIEDLADLETELLLAGNLAGRAQVSADFADYADRKGRAAFSAQSAKSAERFSAHAAERIDFERIPFAKAIDALRDRLGLDPAAFEALDAEARSRAWRVAGVWNMDLLAQIHGELVASIEAGETTRDFRLRLPQMAERNGWTGENPWHADIVQYQNFAMSHAAGRYGEYGEYGVEHWRYASLGESCAICTPLIGKVFALTDRRFFPPLHFWCDCEDDPMFEDEVQPGQVERSQEIFNPVFEEQRLRPSGFKWDPAQYANVEPIDLARYPEELRPAFAGFAAARGWEVAGE